MAAASTSIAGNGNNLRYRQDLKAISSNTGCQEKLQLESTNGLIELGEQRTWKFFIQICLALDIIHEQGIVHADLKPSNLLMAGREYDLKLTDFGISQNLSPGYNYSH